MLVGPQNCIKPLLEKTLQKQKVEFVKGGTWELINHWPSTVKTKKHIRTWVYFSFGGIGPHRAARSMTSVARYAATSILPPRRGRSRVSRNNRPGAAPGRFRRASNGPRIVMEMRGRRGAPPLYGGCVRAYFACLAGPAPRWAPNRGGGPNQRFAVELEQSGLFSGIVGPSFIIYIPT